MDGTAVESAFALLLTKVTKPPYPAKIYLNIAITGVNKNYVPYLALVLERKEKRMMMKRTICGMVGPGSLAHNRRDLSGKCESGKNPIEHLLSR